MCYSREVSLAAGGFIIVGSILSWLKYCHERVRSKIQKELLPFYRDIVLGIGCIGFHQLFEFLSLGSGNIFIYKAGLIFSISCMYFYLRALEHLTHLKFGSRVFAAIILLVSASIFATPITFEAAYFWVRGHAHFVWAGAWMALFIYWNICVLYLRTVMRSVMNRKLLLWGSFAVINLSFFLALIYAYSAALTHFTDGVRSFFSFLGMANMMTSFQLVQDMPSIWCIFASVQVITIPVFFYYMNTYYDPKAPLRIRSVSRLSEIKLVIGDIVIWLLLFFMLPLFPGAAFKMLFK